jgi:GxxExxY protein
MQESKNTQHTAETKMPLELNELTDRVLGAAVAVHKDKGPGFLESIYENCLRIEFSRRHLAAEFQKDVEVLYHGQRVGLHRLDILVESVLIVEIKAVKALENIHFAQVRSYLRATGLQHGLLLNFATLTLTAKRVI